MITETYVRKPFLVDAIQVTADNMQEVAKWAQGDVRITHEAFVHGGKKGSRPYVHVRVQRPLGERQTMAFEGDWVLYAGTGYKVYSNKAFKETFDKAGEGDNPYYVTKLPQSTSVPPEAEIPAFVRFEGDTDDHDLSVFQETIKEQEKS